MPKIIVRHQNQTLNECTLHPGVNTIGRLPTHTVCIENLGISRNHAFILGDKDLKVFVLEDLKSLNGTYVNKKRIHKHLLQSGDVITIGQHALEYREDGEGSGSVSTLGGTKTQSGQSSEASGVAHDGIPAGDYLEDLTDGKRYALDKDILYFGNSSVDDIEIPGFMVGKNFASLNRKGSVWVANLLVKRFSHLRLNAEDIVSAKIKDRDILDVAGMRFRFYQKASA